MSRISGHAIDNREARASIAGIGPLSRTWKPSDTEKALYRLSEGIFIEFTYYEDGRDALIVSDYLDCKNQRGLTVSCRRSETTTCFALSSSML